MAGKRKNNHLFKLIILVFSFVIMAILAVHCVQVFTGGGKHESGEDKYVEDKPQDYDSFVCIDAGHGGNDHGSSAYDRDEKFDTLALVLRVKTELNKRNVGVFLTRHDDSYISPSERVRLAQNSGAEMLVSIHRNAYEGTKDISGVEVWIHSSAPLDASGLANHLLANISSVGGMPDRGVKLGTSDNPAENYTINTASITSCILEMGYMTSESDNAAFDDNMDAYAKAIADAICESLQ